MSAAGESGARRGRRRWIVLLLFGLPLALAPAWCVLLRPELRSLFAPLLGPWAGHLYGHAQCTLASGAPTATLVASVLGAVALALSVFARRRSSRVAAWVLGLPWLVLWMGLALLSVVNTHS